ncbi:MAG: hypothetical protein Q9218_006013 [Villophora microphyllina]
MGSPKVELGVHPGGEEDSRPRKRFKTSELPLNATQRSAIDGLLHTFKKKGEYDVLRKKEEKQRFNDRLNELADAEIDRDSSFLSRERGKAATLMQGAVDRSNVYKDVELSLDRLISEHLDHVLAAAREIRRAEIGEEAAAEEERRGNIPDEVYAEEAAARREARDKQRRKEEARKRREEEKQQLRLEAKEKEAELERLRKMDERLKARERRKEEDRKRRAEEDEERRRYDQYENEGTPDRCREQPQRGHRNLDGAADLTSQPSRTLKESNAIQNITPLIDDQTLEQLALERITSEAKAVAKSNTKPHVERSTSLDPPLRKLQTLKPRSSNISPSKAGFLSPARTETVKPKLSFSSTNMGRDAPNVVDLAPPQGPRGQSPASARINGFSHRNESRPGGYRDAYQGSPLNPEHKSTNNPSTTSIGGRDSGHDEREASTHSRSFARESTRDKEPSRSYDRDERYDGKDQGRHNRHDHEESRSSRHDRSRSRGYPRRDGERDRRHDREDRDRRRDRSRSPYKGSDVKDRYTDERTRADPENFRQEDERSVRSGYRARDPAEIDRYMPSTSARAREGDRDKYRREDSRSHHGQRDQDREHVRDEGRSRDARDSKEGAKEHADRNVDERYREKRDERERDPPRSTTRDERYDDKREDRNKDSQRHHKRDDDRYRAGRDDRKREESQDHGKGDDRYRERRDDRDRPRERDYTRDDTHYHERRDDRDRKPDLFRDRTKDCRDDVRDRDRDRERRDDTRDRDIRKENVDLIDRYVPSGPRSDSKRPREADRSR